MKKREMDKFNRVISFILALLILVGMPVFTSDKAAAVGLDNETSTDAVASEDCGEEQAEIPIEEGSDSDFADKNSEENKKSGEEVLSNEETPNPEEYALVDCEETPVEVVFLPETFSEMEAALPSARSGDWSEALISVARSQLGYTAREDGYSRYADWCSRYVADWCCDCNAEWNQGELLNSWCDRWQIDANARWDACFVSFCLFYSGIPNDQLPPAPSAESWVELLDATGTPIRSGEYVPAPGDLVFFDWDEANNKIVYNKDGSTKDIIPIAEHVAIVSEISDNGELCYIMGDYNRSVQEQQTRLDDTSIIGYVALPEEPQPYETAKDEEVIDLFDDPKEEQSEERRTEESVWNDSAIDVLSFEDALPDPISKDEPSIDSPSDSLPTVVADTYALAPAGYVLLYVRDDLLPGQIYAFDAMPLYYTEHPAYLVTIMDEGAFVLLIPTEYTESGALTEQGAALLTVVEGDREELLYSSDINEDGIVNIADANAIYQMIQNGGDYYSMEQVSLEARLRLMYESIETLDSVMAEINS